MLISSRKCKEIIQNATLKIGVKNTSEISHAELNKKVQSKRMYRKDEFSRFDERQECTKSRRNFQAV